MRVNGIARILAMTIFLAIEALALRAHDVEMSISIADSAEEGRAISSVEPIISSSFDSAVEEGYRAPIVQAYTGLGFGLKHGAFRLV